MTRRTHASRSGITLTEILIGIMIMGIGLVSLATLFPLGLARIREAQRYSRSALLAESAIDDIAARNLFNKPSFVSTWYSPLLKANGVGYDPFTYDPVDVLNPTAIAGADGGVSTSYGPGLPIAYDPLWWELVHQFTANPANGYAIPITPANAPPTLRFGYGVPYVRTEPNPGLGAGTNSIASAHGLQRLSNFVPFNPTAGNPFLNWPLVYPLLFTGSVDMPSQIFTSPDDIVMQTEQGSQTLPAPNQNNLTGRGSPIVPDLSSGGVVSDWTYSWMFTGQQTDAQDGTIFDGSVVVFQNRPLGIEVVQTPFGGAQLLPSGERVVEAVYGGGGSSGLSNRTILLRWPSIQGQPEVRVGGWIADVTYERFLPNKVMRFDPPNQLLPKLQDAQRCYWYQISKLSSVEPSPQFTSDAGLLYNQMTVTVTAALQALTPINPLSQFYEPIHVNAALVSPYVVNVYPKTFYIR
jgi:type II secretory pathway pseudopilin PulG